MTDLTRRQTITTGAAALAASALPAVAAGHPDRAVLDLCQRFHDLMDEYEAAEAAWKAGEISHRALLDMDTHCIGDAGDTMREIMAAPASTPEETAAKLRAVMRWGYSPHEDDPDMRDGSRKIGLLAVLSDLDAMGDSHG